MIFDYFRDSGGLAANGAAQSRKPVYVFVSHSHADHFNPDIFLWTASREITYILSKDIGGELKQPGKKIILLEKGESYDDGVIYAKAYGSTDEGVSFFVRTANETLFHAGDLNNWHWRGESTPEEARNAENYFLMELKDISNEIKAVDLAMFPTDPRLGGGFLLGAEQFTAAVSVGLFAPMHFWDKFESAWEFEESAARKNCREFFKIKNKGDKMLWS
jgi:L-ascorbate metabolism protein UlaG (beta-lactamase superfamily)